MIYICLAFTDDFLDHANRLMTIAGINPCEANVGRKLNVVAGWKVVECKLRDVIFTSVLTHPNTTLLASLLDLLSVDLVRFF